TATPYIRVPTGAIAATVIEATHAPSRGVPVTGYGAPGRSDPHPAILCVFHRLPSAGGRGGFADSRCLFCATHGGVPKETRMALRLLVQHASQNWPYPFRETRIEKCGDTPRPASTGRRLSRYGHHVKNCPEHHRRIRNIARGSGDISAYARGGAKLGTTR